MTPGCARARRICSAISPAGQPFPSSPTRNAARPGQRKLPAVFCPAHHARSAGEALLPLVDRPVELRGEVIHPAALQPRARVGRDLLVGVESLHLRRAPRPPDAEGTDADAHASSSRPSPRRGGASRTCSRSTGASPPARGRRPRPRTSRSSACPETRRRFRPGPSRGKGRNSRRSGCRPRRTAARRRGSPRGCAPRRPRPGPSRAASRKPSRGPAAAAKCDPPPRARSRSPGARDTG